MYKLTEYNNNVQRLADNAFIPFCVDNVDYQRFKVELADGAELLDAEGILVDTEQKQTFLKTIL